MDTKQAILEYIRNEGASSGSRIADHIGVSRQAVNKHLQVLVQDGTLTKQGKTRGAVYGIFEANSDSQSVSTLTREFSLAGLEEDTVFTDFSLALNLQSELNQNAYAIFRYAFTEMLNNAIDHSGSRRCRVVVELSQYTVSFTVQDFGVGIFSRIQEYYGLEDEYAALGELIKGRRTTMPSRHSGEGLFFTSKTGDEVKIQSHAISMAFLNSKNDVMSGAIPWLQGTMIDFAIRKQTRKQLQKVFSSYAPEQFDFQFAKSRVYVQLFQRQYVSRSEARRLVAGLNEFRIVVLDFHGVDSIGQAFADEIYRVFQSDHPEIELETEHANPAIRQMIQHVKVDIIGGI